MDAIKDGSIDKIKKCVSDGCPKWFFAHSVAKKYCTGNCRMKAAHARPEYNEYQRAQQLFLYYFNSPKYGPHHPETEAKRRLVEKVKAQHARRKRRR
jgi:hypothetical protein